MNTLSDPTVGELLEHLHQEADAQTPELRTAFSNSADGNPAHWTEQLRDFYLPVTREQGRFLYQTVRALQAKRVVEFGTSFGISTIYLAAGLRDNGGGVVIGSELIEDKAETARGNLATAGLEAYTDIRTGDARQTLSDPGGPVDLVLLDGGSDLYTEILQLLLPRLRPGALVIADNMDDDHHPYARWVRDPANGFVSSSITLKGGTEYSVWVGSAIEPASTS